MTNPLVSVVIPTHNRASFLVRAIQSVTEQGYRPLEILVADDGSTDDTADRSRSFGESVRHISLTHSGRPSVTRNRAIAQANGVFIAFLDDDDFWRSDKLSSQIDIMAAQPAVGLVFTNGCFLFDDGRLSEPLFSPPKVRGNMFSSLLRDCFIHPSTAVVRKSVLDAAGWFDEDLTTIEDFDLWLRIARLTEMVFLPQPHVTFGKHAGQISSDREHDTWQNMLRVMTGIRRRPDVSIADKLRVRRTLAKTHNRLALLAEGADAKTHYLRAIRWNPLTRAGWRGLFHSVVARRT